MFDKEYSFKGTHAEKVNKLYESLMIKISCLREIWMSI